jgi:alkylhydroperoxidase family enzyme
MWPGELTSLVALGGLALGAGWWARADYHRWIALGPGGLPHTLRGWIRLTRYRLMMRDSLDTAMYAAAARAPGIGVLPQRAGPRPRMAPYPIPHRQLDQYGGTLIRGELNRLFDAVVSRHSVVVHYQLSHFEKHSQAVTLRRPEFGHRHALASHGEVGHVHSFDGSMHMIFSEADARTVIEAGWGERHPLAGRVLDIPNTYIFVYPPRDAFELQIIERLIEAAIAHMSNVERASASAEAGPCRIPYLSADWAELPALAAAVRTRRGGSLLNLDRVLLHSTPLAAAWNAYLATIRDGLGIPPLLRELAICGVAVLNGADYEFMHHEREFRRAGGTAAAARRLRDFESAAADSEMFGDQERAVMQLVLQMTRGVVVDDSVWQGTQRTFPDSRSQVEIAAVIATYNMVSRLLVAARIGPESVDDPLAP